MIGYHPYQPEPIAYITPVFGGSPIHQHGSISGIYWQASDYTVYTVAGAVADMGSHYTSPALSRGYHDYQPAPNGYGVPIFGGCSVYQRDSLSGIHWFGFDYTAYGAAQGMGSRLSKN